MYVYVSKQSGKAYLDGAPISPITKHLSAQSRPIARKKDTTSRYSYGMLTRHACIKSWRLGEVYLLHQSPPVWRRIYSVEWIEFCPNPGPLLRCICLLHTTHRSFWIYYPDVGNGPSFSTKMTKSLNYCSHFSSLWRNNNFYNPWIQRPLPWNVYPILVWAPRL